jgi:hypothetical protein
LDDEYHIKGVESQAIAIQLELFVDNVQGHVAAAPGAVDVVTIGDYDVNARATAELNAGVCGSFEI